MASNGLRSMTKEQLIRLVGQMQDELAAAKTQQPESHRNRYHDIFKGSLDATIVEDDDGNILEANPAACSLFGYDQEEWPRIRVRDLVHPDSWEQVAAVRKEKPPQSALRLRLLRKDESAFEADVMALRTIVEGRSSIVVIVHDLTQLLQAQHLLEASEQTLNEAQELAGLGSYVWDLRDDHLIWSKNMYAIAGIDPGGSVGNLSQTIAEILHPEDRDRIQQEVARMVERRETWPMEFRIVRPDGRLRHLRSGSRFIFDDSGRPIKCIGVHFDITEYKETAWALAHSKASFEALVENLADAVFAHDLDGRLIMVNELTCRSTGYTRSELLTMSVADIDAESVSRDDRSRLWHSLGPGESVTIEAVHRRKDGSTYPAEIKINRIDIGGRPAVVGLARDTTERKNAEQKLRDNRACLRALIDASPDSMLLLEPDGTIVECNRIVERRFGKTHDELIGSNAYDLVGPEVAKVRRPRVEEVLKTGKPCRFEDVRLGRIVDNVIAPIVDVDGSVARVAICGSDVTDSRNLSEEREAMLRLLQIASSSSSLRELARSTVEFMSDRFDFEAVGIRLQSGDDFPYLETRGFGREFVEAENSLCVTDPDGNIRRDRLGNPVLECMCGNVIRGRFNPDLPFFTDQGAFWTNSTTKLLATTSEEDRQARTRNRCNGEGYESVGLFPLRSGGETFGLLQMNDRRPDRFTGESVDLLQRLAGSLSSAVGHFMMIEQVQKSEVEKSLILDSTWEMFLHMDLDLNILWGNRASGDSVGLPRDRVIGRNCYELWHGRSEPCQGCPVLKARDTGEAQESEVETPDGRWFHLRGYPVFGSDGKVASLIEYGYDITESKRAELALRQSEERYRSLVENMQVGVALIDRDMRLLSINRQFREWFPDVEIGEFPKCYEALFGSLSDEVCPGCCVKQSLTDGSVQERTISIETALGDRDIREVSSPVCNGGEQPVAATLILEDITERMRMEKELAKAEKLESIGVLAGGIAHDFNNILVAILGNISLARMELDETNEASEMLSDAEKASERARDLTQQLLTFSKGGAPVTRSTDIESLIRDSAGFTLRGSNSRCEFSFAEGIWQAEVDTGQFSQVIGNLVINAAQAMPTGGVVSIKADNFTVTQPSMLPLRPGDYVRVTVSDSGVGIQPEVLARIFDPFFTTKDTGNGLGLTSCYSIIKRHGGHIDVSSTLDHGATFSVYVPASAAGAGGNQQTTGPLMKGSGRVLVVDDEPSVLSLASHLLQRLGYEPVTAGSGSEAIRLAWDARSNERSFDAAIIDLTIPGGMGGVEILRQLKRIDPGIKAIVSSGYYNDPIMSQFTDHGFLGRIAKPYKADEFSRTLAEVMKVVPEGS